MRTLTCVTTHIEICSYTSTPSVKYKCRTVQNSIIENSIIETHITIEQYYLLGITGINYPLKINEYSHSVWYAVNSVNSKLVDYDIVKII